MSKKIIVGQYGLGMRKHGKSGIAVNSKHFSGKKSGKRIRRKGKELSRKERRLKRYTHVNKYENLN